MIRNPSADGRFDETVGGRWRCAIPLLTLLFPLSRVWAAGGLEVRSPALLHRSKSNSARCELAGIFVPGPFGLLKQPLL